MKKNNELKGIVFNVQRFSINDGPGIRTTVFLKGCPLNCLWCHNPESKRREIQMFYNHERCVACGRCAEACVRSCHIFGGEHLFNRAACIACGKCAEKCASNALEKVGYETTVEEIINEVVRDEIFYRSSGGGITVSGGEPFFQFDFTLELLKSAKKKGLHACIETSGATSKERIAKIAPFVDIFLFDYKETNAELHEKYTGIRNEEIIKNLEYLDKIGCKTVLRCPIIPGFNDRNDHFDGIANTANRLKNVLRIEVEPYHVLGKSKAINLGENYLADGVQSPTKDTVDEWINAIAAKTGVPVKKA